MEKEKKKQGKLQILALFWVLLAVVGLIAVTYAWFSFNAATNVEPMSSTVSEGGASLLIANTKNGEFDVSCKLTPDSNPEVLRPLTTADLNQFYTVTAQNQSGISVLYKEMTQKLGENAIHGTVYLKSSNGSCDVYLYRSGLGFGSDPQALASLRLGLKITAVSGTSTFIFRLDDMGSTGSAKSTRTVPESGTVVSSVSSKGSPTYVKDPSVGLNSYSAKESGSEDKNPTAGENKITTLSADEIASVEYWLYLEGCDDNCINEVQNKDFLLQLGFAGVKNQED
jgi:hypothetical protein